MRSLRSGGYGAKLFDANYEVKGFKVFLEMALQAQGDGRQVPIGV